MNQTTNIKKKVALLAAVMVLFALFIGQSALADQTPVDKANYKLAGRYSPKNLEKMVFSTVVDAHWLKHSERFWYVWETSGGKTWTIVDPVKKTKTPLWDNEKMAADITLMTRDPYEAKHLPINRIKFKKNDTVIYFQVEKNKDVLEAEKKKEEEAKKKELEDKKKDEQKDEQKDVHKVEDKDKDDKKKKEKSEWEKAEEAAKKFHHFEYDIATRKLTLLENYIPEPDRPRWAAFSPDQNVIIFGRDNNLFYMNKDSYDKWLKDPDDKTIEEFQLTDDGVEDYGWHQSMGRGETNVTKKENKDKRKPAYLVWSADSKKFALMRTDEREVKDLWVINNIADPRPTLETYKYQMPGEKEAPQNELWVFDMETKAKLQVKADAFKDQDLSVMRAPMKASSRDDDFRVSTWLSETPDKLYFSRTSRDLKRIDICVADTATGDVTVLVEERMNTYVETRALGFINNGMELVQWSERNGWAHFYLYDGQGQLKKQLTSGSWHCDGIEGIDTKNRVMYFTANAREKDEDPYYLHLYRINLDGTGLKLLNAGNFTHRVSLNDSNRFFVDNFSRVNTAPKAVLKDSQGNTLMDLEETDLSLLMETGYTFPEPFKAKADDGITDIYGVIYKPFDFDESKQYPVIAYVYPGPQTEAVDKAFSVRMDRTDRLAQFGFIVVTLGNRGGHPSRSKWYHNFGYENLRDYGLADKKYVLEQLAIRHPFIDIDKVGIFGHSGGGFMSTAAMLVFPDFFKVAVSSAGNHENNIYNRWWSEKHHGVDEIEDDKGAVSFRYDIEKNSEIAKNLKGRLLICTGDIDNNVHPGNTIRLANALIKANKRFDFFIFPGQRHGFGDMNEYFFWLRSDYFCKHLLGDYSSTVDMIEISKDEEQTGDKKRR
ncbi:MAG: S9 family peptidase [Candidatus Aminicenantes bacterium]|nr:S9 family peptidase [Candidatus Aminicenantes bacterium]